MYLKQGIVGTSPFLLRVFCLFVCFFNVSGFGSELVTFGRGRKGLLLGRPTEAVGGQGEVMALCLWELEPCGLRSRPCL